MRDLFSVFREIVVFAWRGSVKQANNWATLLGGFALLFLVMSGEISEVITPSGTFGAVFQAVLCLFAAWVLIFAFRLVCAPFYLIKERDKKISLLELQQKRSFSAANTSHQAIEIQFEPTEHYMRKVSVSKENARYEVHIRVKNIGNGFLSECRVSIVDLPGLRLGIHRTLRLFDGLNRGDERFVLVASSLEHPIKNQDVYNDVITFSAIVGGYTDGLDVINPPKENSPAIIIIEVEALQCRKERKRFKLWVNDSRRLFMSEDLT